MLSLSFSALLSKEMDVEMKDASLSPSDLPMTEVPLHFDVDLDLDSFGTLTSTNSTSSTNTSGDEPRSPRTPTYIGSSFRGSESVSPFDPERFFRFPILSVLQELSPITSVVGSAAAKSHLDLHKNLINSKENFNPEIPSPPATPLTWIWTCHLCRSRYPLGATRRCLIDGHYYCSGNGGNTTQKNVKRKRRGQSCSSEFDYVGWQDWGRWKGQVTVMKRRAPAGTAQVRTRSYLKGCERCVYPSQCRYEKMNKVPDVVTAMSTKVVDRGVQHERTMVTSSNSSNSVAVKRKNLTVNTGPSKSRPDHESEDRSVTPLWKSVGARIKTSDPISPDLVDFSLSENAVPETNDVLLEPITLEEDNHEKVKGSVGNRSKVALGKDKMEGVEQYGRSDQEALKALSDEMVGLAYGEGKKRNRLEQKPGMTQSRISDFFRMIK